MTSNQRIDNTPGSAGSVTEGSDPAAEQNPAERTTGPAGSLPGSDSVSRSSSPEPRGSRDEADKEEAQETVTGSKPRGDQDGGDYVEEFRPEPVRQTPSEGERGHGEGPQAPPKRAGG